MVVAQRLLRRLCQDCKEAYEPPKEQLAELKLKADLLYRPKGCPKCNQIGYKGRLPVIELMAANNKIRQLIGRRASYQELRQAAIESGMETLFQNGIRKAEKGLTSLEEVLSKTLGME